MDIGHCTPSIRLLGLSAICLTVVATLIGPTPAAAQAPQFKDGMYRVNEQVAPGTYRSTGKGTRCYWGRSGEGENILDNHFGLAGGVVTIQPTDFRFESRGCGPWVALDPANRPAQSVAAQIAPKKDGFYVVGVDIAPGVWWSQGKGAKCYWARQNVTQDIEDNDISFPGGVVTIRPEDFEFYSSGCGTWTMLDTNNLPALPVEQQAAPKKDGIYIIGLNMAPGRWRSNGAGNKCYWEKTSVTQDIIDNHLGPASVIVDIEPGIFQFKTEGCGAWTLGGGVGAPVTAQNTASTAPTNAACPSSNVCILSPANGTVVSRGSVVVFTGTAADPNFARYQFQAGNGQSWGDIADFKQPVTNGELMELHTDTLPPGTYTIRLQVIDTSGNAGTDKAQVTLTIQ
jgi:hypothetical protein